MSERFFFVCVWSRPAVPLYANATHNLGRVRVTLKGLLFE